MNGKLFHSPRVFHIKAHFTVGATSLETTGEKGLCEPQPTAECLEYSPISPAFLPRSPIPGCERPPKSSRCFFFWVPPGERNAFDACLIDVLTEVLPPAAGTPGSREPERESIGSRTCCSIWLRCSRELDFTSEETFPWLSKAQLLQIAYDIKLNCNLPLDGGIMGESTNWCL